MDPALKDWIVSFRRIDCFRIVKYVLLDFYNVITIIFYLLVASQEYSPPSSTLDWLMLRWEMTSPCTVTYWPIIYLKQNKISSYIKSTLIQNPIKRWVKTLYCILHKQKLFLPKIEIVILMQTLVKLALSIHFQQLSTDSYDFLQSTSNFEDVLPSVYKTSFSLKTE